MKKTAIYYHYQLVWSCFHNTGGNEDQIKQTCVVNGAEENHNRPLIESKQSQASFSVSFK